MASEVCVGPKVLQSNIHRVGFWKKYLKSTYPLGIFSEIIASPINLCSLLEDKLQSSFSSVKEYSYVTLTKLFTFVKTNIVHSERSLISPVLGLSPIYIVQQIIQLKLTKQHD